MCASSDMQQAQIYMRVQSVTSSRHKQICETLEIIANGKNIETKLNQTEDTSLKDLLDVGEWKITEYVCDPGYVLTGPQRQICNSKLDSGRWLNKQPYCKGKL